MNASRQTRSRAGSVLLVAALGLCLASAALFTWQTLDLGRPAGAPAAAAPAPDYERANRFADRMRQAAIDNPIGYAERYLQDYNVFVKGNVKRVLPGGEVMIVGWNNYIPYSAAVLCAAPLSEVGQLRRKQKIRVQGSYAGIGPLTPDSPNDQYRRGTVLIDPCVIVGH